MTRAERDGKGDWPAEFSFEALRFKQVIVISSGFIYRGELMGADETDLYLKGPLRYLVLPMDRVTSIRLAGQGPRFDKRKVVPAEFYQDVE